MIYQPACSRAIISFSPSYITQSQGIDSRKYETKYIPQVRRFYNISLFCIVCDNETGICHTMLFVTWICYSPTCYTTCPHMHHPLLACRLCSREQQRSWRGGEVSAPASLAFTHFLILGLFCYCVLFQHCSMWIVACLFDLLFVLSHHLVSYVNCFVILARQYFERASQGYTSLSRMCERNDV